MKSFQIGVLSIQGDVEENVRSTKEALKQLGETGDVKRVKTPEEISGLDALIIPGGESTTIGRLSLVNGALKQIKSKIKDGMPVLGICAGMILLSKTANDRVVGQTGQPLLDLLDVTLERNSFGRQHDSFESSLSLPQIGISEFTGIFIRAPSISSTGQNVQVISKINDKIVAVKQDNIIGTAFHPELTTDVSIHKYLISLIGKKK